MRSPEADRDILVMKLFAVRDERGHTAVCDGPPRKVIFATVERASRAADALLEINAEQSIDEATQVPYPCPHGDHFHLRNNRKARIKDNRLRNQRRKYARKMRRKEKLNAMRAVVAPFLKHEPIRPLWAYYPQPRYPELRTWHQDAWAHNEMLSGMFEEPVSVVRPPFENGIARGPIDVGVDLEEFEQAILYMRAEYERAMGVTPTVIDLPNWARGTILEQIAFTNGFTIADRRTED